MQISVDISLYPLQSQYIPPIKAFIERIENNPDIIVAKNSMSTTLLGDYAVLMPLITAEMQTTLQQVPRSVFVIKLSGGCQ